MLLFEIVVGISGQRPRHWGELWVAEDGYTNIKILNLAAFLFMACKADFRLPIKIVNIQRLAVRP